MPRCLLESHSSVARFQQKVHGHIFKKTTATEKLSVFIELGTYTVGLKKHILITCDEDNMSFVFYTKGKFLLRQISFVKKGKISINNLKLFLNINVE
jgi:hypothetical protein